MRYDVLYQADENYIVWGGISMLSLFENNKDADEIVVHFLSSGPVDDVRCDIMELADRYGRKVFFYETDELRQWLKEQNTTIHNGSYGTYYKLFFERFLPDGIHRLFYMDDDTLVLGDISELFTMKLDTLFGIVKDSAPHRLKDMSAEEDNIQIYNCGTMLINVDKWKNEGAMQKILEYMASTDSYYHDQDIVNRLFKDEITTLPCRYNYQMLHYDFEADCYYDVFNPKNYYSKEEIDETRNNIGVAHFFHFCGESAWNIKSCHPYSKLFQQYFAKSPWATKVKLGKKKISKIQKTEKFMYYILPPKAFLRLWRFMMLKKGYLHVYK